MADPITIITSVGTLLSVTVKLSQGVNDLHGRYKMADLNITALHTECISTSIGLSQLQNFLKERPDAFSSAQDGLKACFRGTILDINSTLSILDKELARLGAIGSGNLATKFSFRNKAKFLWDEVLFNGITTLLRNQRSSITFLIQTMETGKIDDILKLVQQHSVGLQNLTDRAHLLRTSTVKTHKIRGKYEDEIESIFGLEREEPEGRSFETELSESKAYQRAETQKVPPSVVETENTHISTVNNTHTTQPAPSPVPTPSSQASSRAPTPPPGPASNPPTPDELLSSNQTTKPTPPSQVDLHNTIKSEDDQLRSKPSRSGVNPNAKPAETKQRKIPTNGVRRPKLKADAHEQSWDGNTPLIRAAIEGDTQSLCQLLSSKVSPNDEDDAGRTALHYAAELGESEIVSLLMGANRIDWDKTDLEGYTALHYAARNGHLRICSTISAWGVDHNIQSKTSRLSPMHEAACGGHKTTVKLLISRGAKLDLKDSNGNTPLHLAVLYNRSNVIEQYADLNLLSNPTPAPFMGDPATAAFFAAAMQSSPSTTLPYLASMMGTMSTQAGSHKGSRMEIQNHDGQTPLSIAAMKGYGDCASILIEHKADVHTKDNTGLTPLRWAVLNGHTGMVDMLRAAGAHEDVQELDSHASVSLPPTTSRGDETRAGHDDIKELHSHGSIQHASLEESKSEVGYENIHELDQHSSNGVVCENIHELDSHKSIRVNHEDIHELY